MCRGRRRMRTVVTPARARRSAPETPRAIALRSRRGWWRVDGGSVAELRRAGGRGDGGSADRRVDLLREPGLGLALGLLGGERPRAGGRGRPARGAARRARRRAAWAFARADRQAVEPALAGELRLAGGRGPRWRRGPRRSGRRSARCGPARRCGAGRRRCGSVVAAGVLARRGGRVVGAAVGAGCEGAGSGAGPAARAGPAGRRRGRRSTLRGGAGGRRGGAAIAGVGQSSRPTYRHASSSRRATPTGDPSAGARPS